MEAVEQRNHEDLKGIVLDDWQKEVMNHQGNITIRAGRQVGKSTVIGLKAYNFAKDHEGTITMVIAASQRQSTLLFSKIRALFDEDNENAVKPHLEWSMKHKKRNLTRDETAKIYKEHGIYEENPTMTKIKLKSGSIIYCVPTGKTGMFIRGFTIDLLIADEAAYIPETVWLAIMPMIAVSRQKRGMGWIILLSTPWGKGGYFYESFHDEDFKQFHVNAEKCSRIPKDFLLKEKRRLTKLEYAQEYLGEFVDEWRQFFSTELIKKCATFIEWTFAKDYRASNKYYLGVDIARYGGDENAFVVSEMDLQGNFKVIKVFVTNRVSTTDTIGRIIELDDLFHFKRIFTDDGGVGGAVTDVLVEKLGRKVIGINNSSRSVDKDEKQKKIMKEDLYSNALWLMENCLENRTPKVELVNDLKLLKSLKGITYEYTADRNLKIFGKDSHVTEAMVRALWGIKSKGLKLFLA